MIYDNIIIDLANLFYRLTTGKSTKDDAKKIIKFIDEDTMQHLSKDGILYIVSDPLPKSDLGESKSFKFVSYRKEISPSYKKGRTYSPLYKSVMSLILKYYSYRGEKIKLVYSDEYEADDFIEPLLRSLTGTTALITTDEDWCRYLSDKVFMVNKGYDSSFTKEDFNNKYKFYPTEASVTLYKAIYGDRSDNITGCVFLKKVKFYSNIKKIAYDYIKYVADNGLSLKEVIDTFKSATFAKAMKSKNDVFSMLYLELSVASLKENVLDKLYSNIELIRSRLEGKNISQFIHWNDKKESFNSVMRQSVFGLDTKSWFGRT